MNILVLRQRAWSSDALDQSVETDLNSVVGEPLHTLLAEHHVAAAPFPLAVNSGDFDATLLRDIDLVLLNIPHHLPTAHLASEKLFANFATLRQATRLPILLIAPALDETTLVQLYAMGLDDHLPAPHSTPLLAAKLRAWERWIERVASVLYN